VVAHVIHEAASVDGVSFWQGSISG